MHNDFDQFDAPWPDLDGKTILVTGGTGSFGRAFIRVVLEKFSPKRLVVFSRDELKQYEMEQEFSGPESLSMRYFIGDVRDLGRLEMAMQNVDVVIHAAALKHVPAAEYNPFECVHTNVIGAENVVKAALRCGVDRVVALSTDKAASPLNLYGASKLASDKIFIGGNYLSAGKGPRFSVVRYGNVLGSRGSVVPYFEKLLAEGADYLPITDERMTRFWITLRQGVNFVLSSLEMMHGGEIFVPKIPSTKITDIARVIAPDLPTKVIGIRPGEKLHEIMITTDDARNTLSLKDRYAITPSLTFWHPEIHNFEGAEAVADDFSFSSETSERLADEQITQMLAAPRK